jgi:hypothetical protein
MLGPIVLTPRCRLSRDHGIQSWILTISGLGAVATGVVLGGLVVFGVIAGTVAIAASEVILPVLALMAVVALVWGAIAGAKERAVSVPVATILTPES